MEKVQANCKKCGSKLLDCIFLVCDNCGEIYSVVMSGQSLFEKMVKG